MSHHDATVAAIYATGLSCELKLELMSCMSLRVLKHSKGRKKHETCTVKG